MLSFRTGISNAIDTRAVREWRHRGDALQIRAGQLKPSDRLTDAAADTIYADTLKTLIHERPDRIIDRVSDLCDTTGRAQNAVKALGNRERLRACVDMLQAVPAEDQFRGLAQIVVAARHLPNGSRGPILGNLARMIRYFVPADRLRAAQAINSEVSNLVATDRAQVCAGLHLAKTSLSPADGRLATDRASMAGSRIRS